MPEMSDERLADIDRRYGAGGGYTGAPTKQELRLALIELVDEVRWQRRNAHPARWAEPTSESYEAEYQRLRERADQADLDRVQAELRVAKLRVVLTSALRHFTKGRPLGRNAVRSGWVQVATVERWRRVFEETGPAVERAAGQEPDRG